MRTSAWLAVLFGLVHARTTKRDYANKDYYAVHIENEGDLIPALNSIGAHLEHPFGELGGHYLVSVAKGSQSNLQKRSASIKLLQKQIPRQRHKRTLKSIHEREPQDAADLANKLEQTKTAFGIQDPIFGDQWHLLNTQEGGHDVNVTGVWAQGITGKDTVVALVDDGIDMNSRDLAANYYAQGSYDFNDHNSVPSPKLYDDFHGTRCAGEIAAVRNDVCGVGVAYEGRVSGLRILSGRITDVDEALSLNYDFDNNHIYSCSWGPPDDGQAMEAPGILIKRAIVNGIQNGRNGKGSIFVFASGNGATFDDNCNFDGYTNSIFSITIGGLNRLDQHPYYSELCAPQLAVTYSSGAGDYIRTTDVGEDSCSDRHGGTSAAAPLGAGIFALALSIRPDLTWRDMQYLCVDTAVPINLEDDDWKETTAGRKFNHKFGYGKLDAYAMVEKAKSWQLVKKQSWYHSPVILVDEELGTEPHQQVTSYFNITESELADANLGRVEHVTVTVNIQHQKRGDVTVDLASPDGVISNLATVRRNDDSEEGFQDWTFMTVKHWGESGSGQWRLLIGDHDNPDRTGTVLNWKMTLWGESIDESKAVALPMPGDPETPDQHEGEISAPAEVSTVEPVKPPTPTIPPTEIPVPDRPVKPPAHTALPTTIIQPLPEDFETTPGKFSWTSKRAIWLYVACGVVSIFVLALGSWLYLQKRRSRATKEDYEFKELRGGSSRARQGESAGVLYDAFAAGDDDDSDDAASRDSLDEMEPLRP